MFRTDANHWLGRVLRMKKRLGLAASAAAVIGTAVMVRYWFGPPDATAESPPAAKAAAPATPAAAAPSPQDVMAVVNGERITRAQLSQACLRHYGEKLLENFVNKYLISLECQKRGITITRQEIEDEIQKMADKVKLPKEQLLALLEQERGITREFYAKDVIWPMMALRRLAADQLTVSQAEIREAYEEIYGPSVRAQLIQCNEIKKAQKVHALAKAAPDTFGELAKKYSDDVNSAVAKGWIQPIPMHSGDKNVEKVAFAMKEGDISPPIQVGDFYVILKSHGVLQKSGVPTFEKVKPLLTEKVQERKLREVAGNVFQKLQKDAKVQNVLNDAALSKQYPGVAALVDGKPITRERLADECLQRHGQEVLDGEINRVLLEQALAKKQVQVTREDLNAEIIRAAKLMEFVDEGGNVGQEQLKKWVEYVTHEQDVSPEVYYTDAVWPSVALKKLVGPVEVTQADLQLAYESNFGPRVKCQVIVLDNEARARQVWDKARKNPTPEAFGELAAEYSVEASTRANKGLAPPIQKHGGRPVLEEEAFKLKPGDLSGLIHQDQFIFILLCEGYTEPNNVTFKDPQIQRILRDEVQEKKIRLAMAQEYNRLKETSVVQNRLTGEVHDGSAKKPGKVDPSVQPATATSPQGTARR